MSDSSYDALIIGGGHNGLTCACYLAKAGLKVRVLERRSVVGGAAVTEEFHPGFRNSTASYTVSLLNPTVIRDLRLAHHGLRVVERPFSNLLPLPDGQYLKAGGGTAATQAEIAKFSKRDAERLPDYYDRLERVANVLRSLLLETPPVMAGGLHDVLDAWRAGKHLRKLSLAERRDVLDLFACSAGDWLDRWFESTPIKACFGFDSVVGNFASPYTPGSAYVLLHHVFGEVNGKPGIWGHAVGGMGAITQAMAAEARALGVAITTDAAVGKVLVERGAAVGAVLQSGEEIRAKRVIANVNPRLSFGQLVERHDLLQAPDGAGFADSIDAYQCESATFRMNVALSELPEFTCLPGKQAQPHHGAGIIMAPSIQYMHEAWRSADERGWSEQPIVEILIPSVVDDSLAPPGQHVASLFCQHFRYALPNGRTWDEERDQAADRIIDTVNRYAPNFKASVIARQIHSPLDLERKFGLIGGDIFHGKLTLNQLFSARPVFGYGDYRTPIDNLYLCGSGTHPGGGVTGVPGHNAAQEIIRDVKRGKRKRAVHLQPWRK